MSAGVCRKGEVREAVRGRAVMKKSRRRNQHRLCWLLILSAGREHSRLGGDYVLIEYGTGA